MDYEIIDVTSIDIRQVFQKEDKDFTPWLSNNLEKIEKVTRLEDLELVKTEYAVGDYSCDIVASHHNGICVIENQFGKSDHNHFGKLMVYAAGLKANCVIIIAEVIREEHRAAIDYWNSLIGNQCSIYGIEVSLLSFGSNKVFVNLDVVSQPNHWSEEQREITKTEEIKPSIIALHKAVEEDLLEHWTIQQSHIYKRLTTKTWAEAIIRKSSARITVVIDPNARQEEMYNQAVEKVTEVCDSNNLPKPRLAPDLASKKIHLDCPHTENLQDQIAWFLPLLKALRVKFQEE